MKKQAALIAKLVTFFGWVHVKNDDMRKSKKDVWMYYDYGNTILRGVQGDIVPHSRGKRFASFDKFNPFVNMMDALVVVREMRRKGWRFNSSDIGHPKPKLVEVTFEKDGLRSLHSTPISKHPEAITVAALEVVKHLEAKKCTKD